MKQMIQRNENTLIFYSAVLAVLTSVIYPFISPLIMAILLFMMDKQKEKKPLALLFNFTTNLAVLSVSTFSIQVLVQTILFGASVFGIHSFRENLCIGFIQVLILYYMANIATVDDF